jgi:hypothetical protein
MSNSATKSRDFHDHVALGVDALMHAAEALLVGRLVRSVASRVLGALALGVTPVLSAVLAVSTPSCAQAVDLSWRPQLHVGTRATDNLRSTADDQEAAWGFDNGGGVALSAASDTWNSTITPSFNFRRFVIGEDADADEYDVHSETQWAFVERAVASLNAGYARDSTLSTELSDAGRETVAVNRDTVTVNPALEYVIDGRSAVNAGFLYSDVSFEERPGTGFVDYDYKQATLGGRHIYSETLTCFVTTYLSEFRAPGSGGKSLTYGGNGGVSYRFSPTLDGDFAVGYSQSEIDFLDQRVDGFQFDGFDPVTGAPIFVPVVTLLKGHTVESGPIALATIRKAFESTRIELDYSRAISPSSRGAQTVADEILLTLDHDVSPLLMIGLRGGYNMRSTESDLQDINSRALNRDQTQLGALLRYRFNQEMAVTVNYRFVWNQLEDPGRSTFNNALFVNFSYNGDPQYFRGY